MRVGVFETAFELIEQNVEELSGVLLNAFQDGRDKGLKEVLGHVILPFRKVQIGEYIFKLFNQGGVIIGLHDQVPKGGD